MIYATYIQNGSMKRAVLSEKQYMMYQKDNSIQNLQIHGNQRLMETFFNESNNLNNKNKQLLYD